MKDTDRQLTEQQLEKALGILDYMNNVDTARVRQKIHVPVMNRRKQYLGLVLTGGCAAAVLLVFITTRLFIQPGAGNINPISGIPDQVRLTMADGSEIFIKEDIADGVIVLDEISGVLIENGSLVYQTYGDRDGSHTLRADQYNDLIVPRGKMFSMKLEDGSKVWLNSLSRLRFPASFCALERRVFLEGEAYFEVAHHGNRPFIVETQGHSIEVKGTSFNVSAYPEELCTYTTLITGSVALKARDREDELILMPGQQASLAADSKDFGVAYVDADEVAAWRSGNFVFDGIPLEKVFAKLCRWYDLQYTFEDAESAALILRGTVPVYERIEPVLYLINSSGLADIRIEDTNIRIKMKEM